MNYTMPTHPIDMFAVVICDTCITGYRNTLEISIDSKIAKLNAMKVKDPRELLNAAEYLISVLLIMVYPLRYLFYVVRWALRTLKEEH